MDGMSRLLRAVAISAVATVVTVGTGTMVLPAARQAAYAAPGPAAAGPAPTPRPTHAVVGPTGPACSYTLGALESGGPQVSDGALFARVRDAGAEVLSVAADVADKHPALLQKLDRHWEVYRLSSNSGTGEATLAWRDDLWSVQQVSTMVPSNGRAGPRLPVVEVANRVTGRAMWVLGGDAQGSAHYATAVAGLAATGLPVVVMPQAPGAGFSGSGLVLAARTSTAPLASVLATCP
jgi:hypothetical protein